MLRFLYAVIFSLGFCGAVLAEDSDVSAAIGAQIEALEQDDFATAFTYASPSIRQIFRTPENFGIMVQRGYPMVWRPAQVEFLNQRIEAGSLVQMVQITDRKGVVHTLDYLMLETAQGWKINGVRLLDSNALAA